MSKNKKLIIEMLFNNWGATSDRLTKQWIEYRIDLFMKYALKSLLLQSSQDFTCYVLYDPRSEKIIQETLKKYPSLPSNIRFVTPIDYQAHVIQDIKGFKYLYRVYLSSDDMYHKDFIKKLHAYEPKKGTVALVPQYGYIYDSVQKRLGKFFFWLPSYGVTLINVDEYLSGQAPRYSWRDALKVPREFINIKEPIWINHIHGKNTGTTFDNVLTWKIANVHDACLLEPWNNSKQPRAVFGPEITKPNEIKRILNNFF
ncbi:glycosyltransferase [Paenibacillus massiliensis]|uniref:glycosyltransferase n=1 Tax=Paenibacillus massiliensis TaxID=225917 RepID=UPI000423276F|nr:glycosyltransferase [Paenibacillus massiliensis]